MPALPAEINRVLLNLAQLNLLPSSTISNSILNFSGYNDEPVNDDFNNLGYNNINSVENMNSTFLYIILSCFIFMFLMLLGICSEKVPAPKRYIFILFNQLIAGIIKLGFGFRQLLNGTSSSDSPCSKT